MYILLLYGFIYLFFYCANQLEDLFSKCQLGFILFFFFHSFFPQIYLLLFSALETREFFSPLWSLRLSCQTEGQLGKLD